MTKFIDLFAGIGGFHTGLNNSGGFECVFASDIEPFARKTYKHWYGLEPHGDITKIEADTIPDHDLLTGGFPCQPFSEGGHRRGLEDTRGTLFYDIMRIAREKKTKVLLLENVKNLVHHDGGKTWRIMQEALIDEGYYVNYKPINASLYVPQNRARVYIVASREPNNFDKFIPNPPRVRKNLADILETTVDSKYTLSDAYWKSSQEKKASHLSKGSGFGYKLYESKIDTTTGTFPSGYRREILISQEGKNPRRVTPRESARLMGFPEYPIIVSDKKAYAQFGNAVCPAIIEDIGRFLKEDLNL